MLLLSGLVLGLVLPPAPAGAGDELAAADAEDAAAADGEADGTASEAAGDDESSSEKGAKVAKKPAKPVEEITGDIDVEAELADKDADEGGKKTPEKKTRSTKRKRVGKSE